MPHTFIQLGSHWINLDQVTSIDFTESPTAKGVFWAKIHFGQSRFVDIQAAAEVEQLLEFLRARKAN